jgi:hypothetical protein
MTPRFTTSHAATFANARAIGLVACVAVLLAAPSARGDVKAVTKETAVKIEGHIDLAAPPTKVWDTLTSVEGLCTLTGYTVAGPLKQRSIMKLGETLPAQARGETGRLFVTGFIPGQEIRVTWEPVGAGYLCAQRVVLAATPSGGTSLDFTQRYTDSKPNVDETAVKAREAVAKGLEAFSAVVGK